MFDYVYQYKDHLGNIRLSYQDINNNGAVTSSEIREENNYYPFGLEQKGYGAPRISNHPYKFGGKEFNDELGLDWYDVSARNYDPALGRWMNIDPLAEKMRRHSPYNFAFDNPVYWSDPDGMASQSSEWKPDKNGNLISEAGDNKTTLSKHLNISKDEAETMINDQDLIRSVIYSENGVHSGQELKVDNNVTTATSKSTGGTAQEIEDGTANMDIVNDNYLCDEAAQMANAGEELNSSNASKYDQFPNPMGNEYTPGYSQVDNIEDLSLGDGIISIGGIHTVSFYGASNDGTPYVLTKNGRKAAPVVLPLSQVIEQYSKNENKDLSNALRYFKKN